MNRVVHFEIPADNPDRAQTFYADVFGWKFTRWDGPMDYRLAKTGDDKDRGIDGAILPRQAPGASVVNTVSVPSLDASLKTVEKAGGKVILPRMTVPGVGYVAYASDTEGNPFGMLQPDANAK
jgi:hypothetical protein